MNQDDVETMIRKSADAPSPPPGLRGKILQAAEQERRILRHKRRRTAFAFSLILSVNAATWLIDRTASKKHTNFLASLIMVNKTIDKTNGDIFRAELKKEFPDIELADLRFFSPASKTGKNRRPVIDRKFLYLEEDVHD